MAVAVAMMESLPHSPRNAMFAVSTASGLPELPGFQLCQSQSSNLLLFWEYFQERLNFNYKEIKNKYVGK